MDFYLTGWIFLCFSITRRKGQCFIALVTSQENFGHISTSSEVFQGFCLTFYSVLYMYRCMTTSPTSTSCMVYTVEGSTSPTVLQACLQLVILRVTSLFTACHSKCYKLVYNFYVSTFLVASTVFVSTQMWPEIKCPESQEKWNPEKLCLCHKYQCSVILVLQACPQLVR